MLASSSVAELPSLPLVSGSTGVERVANESDRRAHQRLGASELPGIQARLKYGPIVTIVDLSVGGAQIEIANHQLQPGAPLIMQIVGRDRWLAVPAQVLRCHISALGEHPTYRGAIEFRRRLELEQLLRSGSHDPADVRRLQAMAGAGPDVDRSTNAGSDAQSEPWSIVAADGLNAARAMIESIASRRGPDRARPMGMLLKTVAPLFERGSARDVAVASMLDCVRNLIPGATIQLLDPGQVTVVSNDAFYVDVPRGSDRAARRLLIAFTRGGQLETGHLELLRMTANLVALADDVERVSQALAQAPVDVAVTAASSSPATASPASIPSSAAPIPSSAAPAPASSAPASSVSATPSSGSSQAVWRKLIVRYRDGRLLKGYCRGFLPATGQVNLASVPDGPLSSRVTVPLTHLKALFFVRDFDGRASAPQAPESKSRIDLLRGRPVTITFLDGEALAGTTMTYSAEAPGFFVLPLDESSNNEQIFVVNGAVRHIQFT